MASEYNTDPGQGYRIPKRRKKAVAAPPPPPAGMPYRPPRRAVSAPPPPAAGMRHRVKAKPHKAAHKRAHTKAEKRRQMIGAFAQLAGRANGAGHLNPLISRMISTMYADPSHIDWARFRPDVHLVLKKLDKPDIRVHPNEDEPGSSAHTFRGHPASWFDPESYAGYATASPRSFRKDRQNNALSIALHEFAHTRQKSGRMPKWWVEGGADFWADKLARRAGVDYYKAPSYRKYRVRYRRSKR